MNRQEIIQIKSLSNKKDTIMEKDIILLKKNTTICEICLEPLNTKRLKLICNHQFCEQCVVEHIISKCNMLSVVNILCPQVGCKKRFSYKNIYEILLKQNKSRELIKKYLKSLRDYNIFKNDKVISCPVIECNGYAYTSKSDFLICYLNNSHKFCQKCLQTEENHKENCILDIIKLKVEDNIFKCENCEFVNLLKATMNVYNECSNCKGIKCLICNENALNIKEHYLYYFSLCFYMDKFSRDSLIVSSKFTRFVFIYLGFPIYLIFTWLFFLLFSSFIYISSFNSHVPRLNSYNYVNQTVKIFITITLGITFYFTILVYTFFISLYYIIFIAPPTVLYYICLNKIKLKYSIKKEEEDTIIDKNLEELNLILNDFK